MPKRNPIGQPLHLPVFAIFRIKRKANTLNCRSRPSSSTSPSRRKSSTVASTKSILLNCRSQELSWSSLYTVLKPFGSSFRSEGLKVGFVDPKDTCTFDVNSISGPHETGTISTNCTSESTLLRILSSIRNSMYSLSSSVNSEVEGVPNPTSSGQEQLLSPLLSRLLFPIPRFRLTEGARSRRLPVENRFAISSHPLQVALIDSR